MENIATAVQVTIRLFSCEKKVGMLKRWGPPGFHLGSWMRQPGAGRAPSLRRGTHWCYTLMASRMHKMMRRSFLASRDCKRQFRNDVEPQPVSYATRCVKTYASGWGLH